MTGGNANDVFEGAKRTTVPFGTSYFPGDLFSLPKSYVPLNILESVMANLILPLC